MGAKYLYEDDMGTSKSGKSTAATKNTHSNGYVSGTGSSYSGSNAPASAVTSTKSPSTSRSTHTGYTFLYTTDDEISKYSGSAAPKPSGSVLISKEDEKPYIKYSADLDTLASQIDKLDTKINLSIVGDATRDSKTTGKKWKIDGPIVLQTQSYRLSDLTNEPATEKDVYIINPYRQNSYIKKTVVRELIDEVNGEDHVVTQQKYISKLQNLPLNYKKFIEAWKLNGRFADDAMIRLRGDVVEDTVFLNERREAILRSIRGFLRDSSKETYDLEGEFSNSTDGMIRLYNFAKAAIELSTQESKNDLYQIYRYRPLISPDSYSYRIYLEQIPYEGMSQESTASPTTGRSESVMKIRSIIEKMAKTDRFPTESTYRAAYSQRLQSNIIQEATLNSTSFIANPNYHLKETTRVSLDNRNLSFSNESEHLQMLTADALRKFSKTLQNIYLCIDFQDDIIESTIPDRNAIETEGAETGTDKTVFNYLLLEPIKEQDIDGSRTATEFSVAKILDSLIIPETVDHEDRIMEVLNVN